MTKIEINAIEKEFFKRGNPLKKLLKITLELLQAEQVGALYGTNQSKIKFLPTNDWDRGVMDMFDGKGIKGRILKYFGTSIVTMKKLSPVYFFKDSGKDHTKDSHGIISYLLRTCVDYYKQGISIIFIPDISPGIYKVSDQYAHIPFYSYDGTSISEPGVRIKMDLNIIRHFQAKNYVSIYIPDYGILVVNTADPLLMEQVESRFVREKELKNKFDILIKLVENVSLASLGQLKGKTGARLLWKKEKQLRRTSRELLENEKKYRYLYENAPIAYFSIDNKETIVKCNNSMSELSGYGKQELIGMNIMDFHVNGGDKTITPDQVRSKLEQGRSVRDIEMKFRNKEQEDIWVSLSLDSIRDRDKIIETRVMATDISKRKGLEKQLLQAQKMEAIGTLAGGIAHDFNNILTPISGYTEMLLMEVDDKSKQKEHLQIVHDCALYAKGLVNQMLTFAKQKENEFKLLQPHVFVRDALALTKSFLPATIEIRESVNDQCGLLMVDPIQLHQVVMNLISNAYQAMEEKGGVLDVFLDDITIKEDNTIFPLSPGTYVCLRIADTGPGIPPEILKRIFDPFFTTRKEGKGSGIGLAVVHGIIQSHKGYINVKSKQGEGSCFEVYLPVYIGDIQPEDKVEEDQVIQKGNETILLVDDDKKVAFMEQHMLEKLGYEVICCLSSTKALEVFQKTPDRFDLVITDLTMPVLTGYELSEKIFEIRQDIPIVLCTGYGEHINKNRYNLQGVKGFLNKPVTVKKVSSLLREILDALNG